MREMRRAILVSLLLTGWVGVLALWPAEAQQSVQRETFSRCVSEGVASVAINTATAGNVQLVALAAGKTVYVCGFTLNGGGTVGAQFITGTGTACATDEADLTGVYSLADTTNLAVPNAGAVQFHGAASSALCVELSGAVQINGSVTYVQY